MLSDIKPLSMRIAELLTYCSYFEQTVEEESRRLATGKQRQKQKHLPRINTELHGRKQKHLPRINTEFFGKIHAQFIEQKGSGLFFSSESEPRIDDGSAEKET